MLILNFDIAKSKQYLYESHPDVKVVNKEVCKVSPLNYILEYVFTLEDIEELKKIPEDYEKQIADIYRRILEFYEKCTIVFLFPNVTIILDVKGTKYPLILYVHGLDVLSCYLKEQAITRMLIKMIEEIETLSKIMIFISINFNSFMYRIDVFLCMQRYLWREDQQSN